MSSRLPYRLKITIYGARLNRASLFKKLSKFLDIKINDEGDLTYSIIKFGKNKYRTLGFSFELADEISFEQTKVIVSKIKKIDRVNHVEVHAVVYYDMWNDFFELNKFEADHEAIMDRAIKLAKRNEEAAKAIAETPNAHIYRVVKDQKELKLVVTDGPMDFENNSKNVIAEVELE